MAVDAFNLDRLGFRRSDEAHPTGEFWYCEDLDISIFADTVTDRICNYHAWYGMPVERDGAVCNAVRTEVEAALEAVIRLDEIRKRRNWLALQDVMTRRGYVAEAYVSGDEALLILIILGRENVYARDGEYFVCWDAEGVEYLHRAGDDEPTARNEQRESWLSLLGLER